MSEASPEAEGTLVLTLSSRDDSSFSGIMDVGLPATGTGSAYVWHEGSELRIVTVAASGTDTILWSSRLTDAGLGGKYEVTGGDRLGQGGTWRAHLTQGPPATPATLLLPQSIPLPPASAMWPLVLVVLVAVWMARWIRAAPQPAVSDTQLGGIGSPLANWRPGPKGVGGWLAFFVVAHSLGVVAGGSRLVEDWSLYADALATGPAINGLQPLVVFEMAIRFPAPLIEIVGIALILKHSRFAPRYWFGYIVATAIAVAVDESLGMYVDSEWTRLLGAAYTEEVGATNDSGFVVLNMVASVVWGLYWVRSERVRATFGAAALERPRPITPIAVPA